MDQLFCSYLSRIGAASGHFQQTIRAERPARVSSRRNYQDCDDLSLRVCASPADQVIALASGLESDLGDRGGIVDQLDSNQIEFSFQSLPFARRLAATRIN
jgi:hypothetical protein